MNHWIRKSFRLWKIDDGEQWWYSATTKEDALGMHMFELIECGMEDEEDEEVDIDEVPFDTIVPVSNEDGTVIRKTSKEWAFDGKGLVASTIF